MQPLAGRVIIAFVADVFDDIFQHHIGDFQFHVRLGRQGARHVFRRRLRFVQAYFARRPDDPDGHAKQHGAHAKEGDAGPDDDRPLVLAQDLGLRRDGVGMCCFFYCGHKRIMKLHQ
ncbi:hypothetical protein [Janthinobacterium lividum]|uniref:hypothetical protein n=1 Tax=Janthinobacterium lividum TaxID=29581 RepID=UPI000FE1D261|nr:hypothetical protein [Janthinobacterium lividum]